MTVLICGIWSKNGAIGQERRGQLVTQMAEIQNQGGLVSSVNLAVGDGITLGRLNLFAHTDAMDLPVSQDAGGILCGDFRLYDEAAITSAGGVSCETELSAVTEKRLLTNSRLSLDGDFAFASWNGLELTLVRDSLGVRPLYYLETNDLVAFASLPMGLVPALEKPAAISEEAVLNSLMGDFCDFLFKDIQQVEAGTEIVFNKRKQNVINRRWSLKSKPKPTHQSFEQAAETLCGLIETATHKRLSRFGRTASHLSSGLDSSAVSLLAAQALEDNNKRLLALGLADPFFHPEIHRRDEVLKVRSLIQQKGGIDFQSAEIPGIDRSPLDQTLLPLSDIPADSSVGEAALSKEANHSGADIILTGYGGDQFASASGHTTLTEMFLRGTWRKLWRTARALAQARGWKTHRVILHNLAINLFPEQMLAKVRPDLPSSEMHLRSMEPFLTRSAYQTVSGIRKPRPKSEAARRQMDWQTGSLQHQLTALAQFGALNGVRYAHPLLDVAVVEFAHSLPTDYFVAQGHRRAIMRAALTGAVPDEVRLATHKASPSFGTMTKLAQTKHAQIQMVERLIECKGSELYGIKLDEIRNALEALPTEADAIQMDNDAVVDTHVLTALELFETVALAASAEAALKEGH